MKFSTSKLPSLWLENLSYSGRVCALKWRVVLRFKKFYLFIFKILILTLIKFFHKNHFGFVVSANFQSSSERFLKRFAGDSIVLSFRFKPLGGSTSCSSSTVSVPDSIAVLESSTLANNSARSLNSLTSSRSVLSSICFLKTNFLRSTLRWFFFRLNIFELIFLSNTFFCFIWAAFFESWDELIKTMSRQVNL